MTLAICAGVAWYLYWLTDEPTTVTSAAGAAGQPAELTLQTVGTIGPEYDHPAWVSYLSQNSDGEWVHSTNLEVRAHSLVRVTIHQFDSATGLRNNFFGRVQGTTGDVMQVDGRTVGAINPNSTAHTFAVPQLGIFVPLPGANADAPNFCNAAPCSLEQAHRTVTFTFRAPGKGRYRFQCFVPCGAGFQTGNGGPMQTFNYMTGFLKVV